MTKSKNLSEFYGGEVVVRTFRAYGENSHNKIRVAPIPEEGFPPGTRVQCSRKMRADHPVGTFFRLYLTVRDTGGSPTLFAQHDAPYEVVDPVEVELAGKAKRNAKATADFDKHEKRSKWFIRHPVFLKHPPEGTECPRKTQQSSQVFQRSPLVSAWLRHNSNGKCEACGRKAPFKDKNNYPFLEVHHVVPLALGGSDSVSNAVAICPNCHRSFHHSNKAEKLTSKLYQKIERLRKDRQ